ncbi:MAG: hypothetical protein CVV42_11630 [Candidatus Riflebacteria bacterium HGW-Riflebacteria-2]|jgi:hypothetical protein|nr:MAG: hypothetical protein CVV42_11630 [Candidatus Riflebacteria bacterium HGW-Riflebacteria-2]
MNLPFADNPAPATFLIGGTGAGKTELALNLSLYKARRYQNSTLIDFDIVNPFFRVRKLRDEVEKHNVSVICPVNRVVSGDIPALPAAAWGAVENISLPIVCDIGGGETGLRPLARMSELAAARNANVFFVINPFRPGFAHPAEIAENFRHMCGLCAMKVTHIVANPNIGSETTVELFYDGLKRVREFAATAGVPIAFAVAAEGLARELGTQAADLPGFAEMADLPLFVLERYWSVPWHFGTVPDA